MVTPPQDLPPADDDSAALPADPAVPSEDEQEEDLRHFHWKVTKNLTRRVDQYLVDRVGYLSRNGVQKLIEEGLVKVNGKVIKASYHPRDGDQIEMVAPPEPVNELIPENIPLDIVYEDEQFLALNKQADLIVHPARGKWSGTLVNGLVYYGKKWSNLNGNWRPGILHRLDRNTTGIMLVAKADEAHWRIARQFENRTIKKTYMALCHGVPPLLSDVINMPIGRDKYVREKQAIRKIENGGREAITIYETQATYETPPGLMFEHGTHEADKKMPMPGSKFSLIKLSPQTGRTHQLRVHMAAIGFPMVGDTMYGGKIISIPRPEGDFRFARQALHAFQIKFVHPGTLQTMMLEAPLPPDIQALLSIMRREETPAATAPGDGPAAI